MPTLKQSTSILFANTIRGARSVLYLSLVLAPCASLAQQVEPSQFRDSADIRAMTSPLAPVPDDAELNGLRGTATDAPQSILDNSAATGTHTQYPQVDAAGNAPVVPATSIPTQTFASPSQFESPASGMSGQPRFAGTAQMPPVRSGTTEMPGGPEPSANAQFYDSRPAPARQQYNDPGVVNSGGAASYAGSRDYSDYNAVQPAAYQQTGPATQGTRQPARQNTALNQQASSGTSSELQLDLARSIMETFSIDAATEPLPGRPIQLVDFLQRTPLQQRQQMINQYWETYYDWANLRNASEHLRALQSIQAPQDPSQRVLLNAARSNASNDVLESEIQLVKSQSILQEFLTPGVPASSGSILPLPSDTPMIQRFEAHYEWYASRGRVPQRLLGFDLVLPKALQLISDRAETVRTARSAWNQSKTARGGVPQMLEAARLWRDTQQELIKSVISYNRALADYSLAIAPVNSSPDQVIAMLIAKPEVEIPAATPAQQASNTRINSSTVLQNQPVTRTPTGGFGGASPAARQQTGNAPAYQSAGRQNPGIPSRSQMSGGGLSLDPAGASPNSNAGMSNNPLAPVQENRQAAGGGFAPQTGVRSGIGDTGSTGTPAPATVFAPEDLTTRRGTLPRDGAGGGFTPGAGGGEVSPPASRAAQNPIGPAPSQRTFGSAGTNQGGSIPSAAGSPAGTGSAGAGGTGSSVPAPPPSRSGSGGTFGGADGN